MTGRGEPDHGFAQCDQIQLGGLFGLDGKGHGDPFAQNRRPARENTRFSAGLVEIVLSVNILRPNYSNLSYGVLAVRVCLFTTSFLPQIGGAEHSADLIARGLMAR